MHQEAASAVTLVHGAGGAGAALAAHPDGDGVGFTGSWEVGVAIRRATVEQTGKVLALEMGGKNATIVREDADVERAVAGILSSVLWSCGQRCTATSRVLVHASRYEEVRALLCQGIDESAPGDPRDLETVLGPLATEQGQRRFDALRDERAGLRLRAEGKLGEDRSPGWWVRPRLYEVEDVEAARERIEREVFGPELLLERVDDDEGLVYIDSLDGYEDDT